MKKNSVSETLLISLKDELRERSKEYSGAPASYFCNYFCRVPGDWTEGNRMKESCLEKILKQNHFWFYITVG